MALSELQRAQFHAIVTAASCGALSLVETTDKEGRPVAVLCAVSPGEEVGKVRMSMLGRLFLGDPLDEVQRPERRAEVITAVLESAEEEPGPETEQEKAQTSAEEARLQYEQIKKGG